MVITPRPDVLKQNQIFHHYFDSPEVHIPYYLYSKTAKPDLSLKLLKKLVTKSNFRSKEKVSILNEIERVIFQRTMLVFLPAKLEFINSYLFTFKRSRRTTEGICGVFCITRLVVSLGVQSKRKTDSGAH